MRIQRFTVIVAGCFVAVSVNAIADVQLGPRPFYLIESMDEGELKQALQACEGMPTTKTEFSIGHRGAPLQFPEHTKESYTAAAKMGAGILECDVTFTKDRELVCRHSQCDLHTTTNILQVPELAAKCSAPFKPAEIDVNTGEILQPATAKCCTSDITVDEFLSLKGKMDAANPAAFSVDAYLDGTADFRTDLYTEQGTLLTHAQSIELFQALDVGMTPELKSADVDMPYEGEYTQEVYAQQLVNEYLAADVPSDKVWLQSFNIDDVKYWIDEAPEFGQQAVYLDGRYSEPGFDPQVEESWEPSMQEIKAMGINIVAPPMWALLTTSEAGEIVPSAYAEHAIEEDLAVITWTLERSGPLVDGGGWYYQSVDDVINNDGDVYEVLDVLATDVGVQGVFSDWAATVTYYANCMGK